MNSSKKSNLVKRPKKSGLGVTSYSHAKDTMKIIYGVEESVAKGIEFMKNVEKKMDLCYDKNAPSIVLKVKEYKNGYLDVRKRGGKIRIITEITKDNLEYCKELTKIVTEIRHLDNVQGGIAINEKEYMATNVLHESKPLTQVIYSNVLDIVEQQQKFFESLWNTAIPAKQKFKEFSSKVNPGNNDIFSVLSNETRRSIIFYLSKEEMSASQLSKKLQMTLQAMQKHLPKLLDAGIVEKKNDGAMKLTQIGYILTKQIPSIEFLSENISYLKTHFLSSLPSQFLQRIGDLEKFEIVHEGGNIEKFDNLLRETDSYIKILSKQNYFDLNTEMISNMLKKEIRVFQVSDENATFPKMKMKQEKTNIYKTKEFFKKKTSEYIPLLTLVSEKSACLAFFK